MCATVFMSALSVQHVLRVSVGALLKIFSVINRAHSPLSGTGGTLGQSVAWTPTEVARRARCPPLCACMIMKNRWWI